MTGKQVKEESVLSFLGGFSFSGDGKPRQKHEHDN